MSISFRCQCGKTLSADESRAGHKGRCATCQTVFVVPTPPHAPKKPVAKVILPPVKYDCPHCDATLEVEGSWVGQTIQCGSCYKMTVVPDRSVPAPKSSPASSPFSIDLRGDDLAGDVGIRKSAKRADISYVTVPILVSGVGNVVIGLVWIGTVICLPIGLGMTILCVFEFIFYSNSDTMSPSEAVSRAKTLGILEIVAGLFNIVSLVCGIIVLVNLGKVRRQI